MTPEEMQQRKREMGLTYEQLSLLCGVPAPTIQKIITGSTENPYSYNRQALEKVLNPDFRPDFMVREKAAAYSAKSQGAYTADDYYALPDDQNCELIDGVLYTMEAPGFNHQTIVEFVGDALKDHVKRNGGPCLVRMVVQDVKVSKDDKTIVQPDIFVLCDRSKITRQWIYGAPDLIVEVLSKSTKKKDCTVKLDKYRDSGVREYWAIDPKEEMVACYDFEKNLYFPKTYTFDQSVPVGIWEGSYSVDFSKLKDQLIDFGPEDE